MKRSSGGATGWAIFCGRSAGLCSIRGSSLHDYGLEDVNTVDARELWSFEPDQGGDEARAACAQKFWETLHIDLRMVDTSDFTIAFVPTNVYSVGTVHEIVLARQQLKPVLFVSPPVSFPSLEKLREHLRGDAEGLALLEKLATEVPIKPNTRGIPSLWYMPLIGGGFFDGFGFANYIERFRWEPIPLTSRRSGIRRGIRCCHIWKSSRARSRRVGMTS
jgi:hypothetical protein